MRQPETEFFNGIGQRQTSYPAGGCGEPRSPAELDAHRCLVVGTLDLWTFRSAAGEEIAKQVAPSSPCRAGRNRPRDPARSCQNHPPAGRTRRRRSWTAPRPPRGPGHCPGQNPRARYRLAVGGHLRIQSDAPTQLLDRGDVLRRDRFGVPDTPAQAMQRRLATNALDGIENQRYVLVVADMHAEGNAMSDQLTDSGRPLWEESSTPCVLRPPNDEGGG